MSTKDSIVGVILARFDSQRLPGKVLRPLQSIPLLGHIIHRASRIPDLDGWVVATSDRSCDDPIEEFVRSEGGRVFRGNPEDVADRVLRCAHELGAGAIARLNADSPFLDPELTGMGIRTYREGAFDLVTNLVPRTYPYGIAVEILRVDVMERIQPQLRGPEDREHLTRYLYDHLDQYHVGFLPADSGGRSEDRMVVDTVEDLRLCEQVFQELGSRAGSCGYAEAAEAFRRVSFSRAVPRK